MVAAPTINRRNLFKYGAAQYDLEAEDVCLVNSFQFLGPNNVAAKVSLKVRWEVTGPAVRRGRGDEVEPTDPAAFLGQIAPARSTAWFSGSHVGFSFAGMGSTDRGLGPAESGAQRRLPHLRIWWQRRAAARPPARLAGSPARPASPGCDGGQPIPQHGRLLLVERMGRHRRLASRRPAAAHVRVGLSAGHQRHVAAHRLDCRHRAAAGVPAAERGARRLIRLSALVAVGERGESPCRWEGSVEECHSFGWCLVVRGTHAEGTIMRVFVAGATGALGRHLVPGLVAAGHEVTATTRTPGKAAPLREAGAKPPLRMPAWLGRLLAAEFVVAQMANARGSSNEKARKELGWEPRYASWREGLRARVSG
jgi:hypothetical protein